MHKLNSLRQALIDAVPQLNDHPDHLQMSVGSGNIDARLASSLSFEKKYELQANISSFGGDSEGVFVPVLAWLRENGTLRCTVVVEDRGMDEDTRDMARIAARRWDFVSLEWDGEEWTNEKN